MEEKKNKNTDYENEDHNKNYNKVNSSNEEKNNSSKDIFFTNINKLLPNLKTFKQIGRNKQLSQFGDIITNLIYSAAKSLILGKLQAQKVNRTILSMALKEANMKHTAPLRSNAHDLADTVEAFVGYAYLFLDFSIPKMSQILFKELTKEGFQHKKEETEQAAHAFAVLLEIIKKELLSHKFDLEY